MRNTAITEVLSRQRIQSPLAEAAKLGRGVRGLWVRDGSKKFKIPHTTQ